LTQLEVLKLSALHSPLDKVVGFAKMPALRYLDFGRLGCIDKSSEDCVHGYLQVDLQRLDLLADALAARPLKLRKVRYKAEPGILFDNGLVFAETD